MFRSCTRLLLSNGLQCVSPASLHRPASNKLSSASTRSFHSSTISWKSADATLNRKRCPSCGQTLRTFLPACTKCWFIADLPSNTSYHELLGLPEEMNPFIVDAATLKRNFREAQTVCHPDTWASKGQNKQDLAHALSSLVNDAYQRLLNPLSRAEYILERNGHPMSEEDKLEDMMFISEIMEAREEIESAENKFTVREVQENNREKIKDTLDELEGLIGYKDWSSVKEAAIRLKYLDGIERAAQSYLHSH